MQTKTGGQSAAGSNMREGGSLARDRGRQMLFDTLDDGALWIAAEQAIDRLPVFEENERGDRHDTEFLRGNLLFVDVDLDDLDGLIAFFGEIVEDRSDCAAGTAPGSPEIDQHQLVGLYDFALELGVCNLCALGHSSSPTWLLFTSYFWNNSTFVRLLPDRSAIGVQSPQGRKPNSGSWGR